MSAPVAGFHIGECSDVEQAHFWSPGPLVNGVRSYQLIIKHDMTSVSWPDTWCPHQCPGFKSVRAPMWNRLTSGARDYL